MFAIFSASIMHPLRLHTGVIVKALRKFCRGGLAFVVRLTILNVKLDFLLTQ